MKWVKITLFILDGILVSQLISSIFCSDLVIIQFLAAMPISLWIVLVIHELMHASFFLVLGFPVKELKIGLFLVQFERPRIRLHVEGTGFFCGFCTVYTTGRYLKWKAILSLLAGGLSGMVISTISIALIIQDVIPPEWDGVLFSFVFNGYGTFVISLLRPQSTDRILIERIVKER